MDRNDPEHKDFTSLIRRAMPDAESSADMCPDNFLLAQYIEKRLSPDKESRIESHLVACHACRQAVIAVAEAENASRGQSAAIVSGNPDMERLLQELENRCGVPHCSTRSKPNAPHIMIVDDDKDYLQVLEDTLSHDYRVTACSNGREALGRISDGPRVIVLDIKMPGMNGFEVARRINRLKDAPAIIFNTGYSGQYSKTGLLGEHCFFDYVTKDNPSLLLNAIKRSCAETAASPD